MKQVKFKYCGEIRGKGRPRFHNVNGWMKAYTDADTRNYEASLKESYLSATKESDIDNVTFFKGEPLKLKIEIYQAVPKSTSNKKRLQMLDDLIRPTKKPDLDNIIKSVCDSLNKVAWNDDTQIVELDVKKFYGETDFMWITITETEPTRLFDRLDEKWAGGPVPNE